MPPNYFFAMFGDPSPPAKDTVESGIYHPDPKVSPFPPKPGDVLLLYCTEGYAQHPMQVPGIGIVLKTDDTSIRYRYLPLSQPISKDILESKFSKEDLKKFKNRRYSTFWLFDLSKESFTNSVGNRNIAWP